MSKDTEKAIRKRMQKLAFDANMARLYPPAYPYAWKALEEYNRLKAELSQKRMDI
jgi:hypothetical protein